MSHLSLLVFSVFFFNDTATTEIYTLSLHDALPISSPRSTRKSDWTDSENRACYSDRKSTRLNSSHLVISYAVFCLKKTQNKLQGETGARLWWDAHVGGNAVGRV